MNQWPEKIANYSLILVATFSIVIGIGDVFFDFQQVSYLKETAQITLLVVGILGLSLGIERVISFRRLNDQLSSITSVLDDLKQAFTGNINTRFIDTSLEILEVAAELTRNAEDRIYVLSFDLQAIRLQIQGTPQEKDAFKKWFDTLISTVKQHQNFDFRIVFTHPDQLLQSEINLIGNEKRKYQDAGILSRCQIRTKQVPLGFSLLLVDDKHLLIGFPMNTQDSRPSNAIKLMNNPKLVSRLAKWFELCIWDRSDNA
jgi:hypothetical protein